MNKAQCPICTESLECTTDDVSAVKCGHVFHAGCLARWLNESSTCPQCRIKVVPKEVIVKLYFADDRENSVIEDNGNGSRAAAAEIKRVNDELSSVRILLNERVRELARVSAEKRSFEQKIIHLTESLSSLESLHQKQIDSNRLLRQQLSAAQTVAGKVNEAMETSAALRQKVSELQSVQAVINGFQSEVESMVRENNDPAQLATWCCVLRSELALKRNEFRDLSETHRQTKRNLDTLRSTLADRTAELAISNGRIASLEEDIAAQNKEIGGLRKKIDALQQALGSPSDTAVGFARRLIHESPAPQGTWQTPKLSAPTGNAREIDLDTSMDLFLSPGVPERQPGPPIKRSKPNVSPLAAKIDQKDNPVLVMTSGGSKAAVSVSKREPHDISNRPMEQALSLIGLHRGLVGSNLKRSQSSVFREGYNGFGGHEKVILPKPKGLLTSTTGSKKLPKKVFGPLKTSSSVDRLPPVPSLPSASASVDDLVDLL